MSFVTVKLADLFRAKTKQDSTKKTVSESAEGDSDKKDAPKDGEGDSDGESDKKDGEKKADTKKEGEQEAPKDSDKTDGEGDSEGESDATAEAKDGDTLTMTASTFNTMKKDAAEYGKVKGELETLRGWKASMDKVNGGLGKADQSDSNGKSKPSVLDSPWNKAAQAAAERVK